MEAPAGELEIHDFLVEGHSAYDLEHKRETLQRFLGAPTVALEGAVLKQLRGIHGIYALYVAPAAIADPALPQYLSRLAAMQLPVYLGKAQKESLMSRLSTHRKNIALATNLDEGWFRFKTLRYSCTTISSDEIELTSLVFDDCLPWNGSGFGNKDLGGRRGNQKLADWDVVHPGRGREGGQMGRSAATILAKWQMMVEGLPAALEAYEAALANTYRVAPQRRILRAGSTRFGAYRRRRIGRRLEGAARSAPSSSRPSR